MPKLHWLPLAALVLFLTAGLAAFGVVAGTALRTQEQLDYGEGIVLWQATNVTDWAQAYHPVENYPHIVFHDPPVYHLTARLMASTTGNLLAAGRLTSILSLLGSCLVMALLTAVVLPSRSNPTARWLGAFSAGTLIFTTPVWTWACLMRVDTLAVFLSITGLAIFILARRRPALAFLSFACFVAAVYTKQTMIAAPAACLLLCFMEKPRLSALLLAFAVLLGMPILFILQTATHGLFLRHIISYNQNPLVVSHVFSRWIGHLSTLPALLMAVSVLFPVALFWRRAGSVGGLLRRVRLALGHNTYERCVVVLAVYFWFAAAVATATIGKQGASVNYFFEVDIAVCLLSGLFLGWVVRRASFRPRGPHAVLASFVVALLLLHSVGNLLTLYMARLAFVHPTSDHSEEVLGFVQGLPGPIYSEDMTLLMRAGKEIPAEPAIITALAMNKKWDERGFVRRIEAGQFQAVIAHSLENRELFTESVARAVLQRYYLSREFGSFKVYQPK